MNGPTRSGLRWPRTPQGPAHWTRPNKPSAPASDSVITPAISVMGAVEGLEILTPVLKPFVMPISLVVLVGCS